MVKNSPKINPMDRETHTTTVACPQLPLLQLAMTFPREFEYGFKNNVSYGRAAFRYFQQSINSPDSYPTLPVHEMELQGWSFLAGFMYDWPTEEAVMDGLRDLCLPGVKIADAAMFVHEFMRFRFIYPHSSLYRTGHSIMKCRAATAKIFHNAFCIYSSMGGVNEQDTIIAIDPDARTITVTSTSLAISRNAAQDLRFALATALAGPYSDYIERHIALYNGPEVDPENFLDDGRTFPQYLTIY